MESVYKMISPARLKVGNEVKHKLFYFHFFLKWTSCKKVILNQRTPKEKGQLAKRSTAFDSSSNLERGVGSNPTLFTIFFSFQRKET
jgi:hypothetical protein